VGKAKSVIIAVELDHAAVGQFLLDMNNRAGLLNVNLGIQPAALPASQPAAKKQHPIYEFRQAVISTLRQHGPKTLAELQLVLAAYGKQSKHFSGTLHYLKVQNRVENKSGQWSLTRGYRAWLDKGNGADEKTIELSAANGHLKLPPPKKARKLTKPGGRQGSDIILEVLKTATRPLRRGDFHAAFLKDDRSIHSIGDQLFKLVREKQVKRNGRNEYELA